MSSPWLRRLLTRSTLAAGWARVAENAGAPGVDGVSIPAFSMRLEAEFTALQHEVLAGSYQPEPLLSVWLERPGKKRRELGIPAVRDRVLQSACALLIGPTLEANFEDCSLAYRQGRSVKQAVARVERLRDEGCLLKPLQVGAIVADGSRASCPVSIPHPACWIADCLPLVYAGILPAFPSMHERCYTNFISKQQ